MIYLELTIIMGLLYVASWWFHLDLTKLQPVHWLAIVLIVIGNEVVRELHRLSSGPTFILPVDEEDDEADDDR